MTEPEVVISEDATKLGEYILKATKQATGSHFTVALSGGSLPKVLASALTQNKDINLENWLIFFADERYVSLDHEDSNFLANRVAFFDKLGVKAEQVFPINPALSLEECAMDYEKVTLKKFEQLGKVSQDGIPIFDLVLLGMGPDGHTCSLFPGHKLLTETTKLVATVNDSPKPPPERVTYTFPVLNNADNVFFVANGKSKENVIPQVVFTKDITEKDLLPAARVKPHRKGASLVWFIDQAAAKNLEL